MYLVATPTGDLLKEASRIQGLLSDSWEFYQNSPPTLHITISTVKKIHDEELDVFSKSVQLVLDDFESIKIHSNCFDCFTEPHKSLVLKIEENEKLQQLQNSLTQTLEKDRFLVPSAVNKWIFHITILSEIFAKTPLENREFLKVCQRVALRETPIRGVIERLELWRPVIEEEERVVRRYYLK